MVSLSDFSSLLQLGVGLGLGISVFRAPIDVKIKYIDRIFDSEFQIIGGLSNAAATSKRNKLSVLRVEYEKKKIDILATQRPYIWAALFGAAMNFFALVAASFNPDVEISIFWQCGLTFISGIYFVFILGFLECLARNKFSSTFNELRSI